MPLPSPASLVARLFADGQLSADEHRLLLSALPLWWEERDLAKEVGKHNFVCASFS